MINKSLNLKSYLVLLYCNNFKITAFNYYKITNILNVYKKFTLNNNTDYYLLNFSLFSCLFHNRQIAPEMALIVLPRILNKIQLGHVMGTEMQMDGDQSNIVIDADISAYGIKTVEIKMTSQQMAQYF